MLREVTEKILDGNNLTTEEARGAMLEIMGGEADPIMISAYLAGLRAKGETVEEIVGSALGMRKMGLTLPHEGDVLEIVGTGGDKAYSINISTAASIICAAYGIPVAKHGNRSVSSKCGAADLLEELGVKLDLEPEQNAKVLSDVGICFMFAQKYHTAMKYVAPVRKALGMRTIFNILGPLTNPAKANYQMMGVYSEELVEPMAEVLARLGVGRGMVVYGQDCLDEVSLCAKTSCCRFTTMDDGVHFDRFEFDPTKYGFTLCSREDVQGGSPEENARIIKGIFAGDKNPKRDVIILNAAAAIYMMEHGTTMTEAIKKASDTVDSGRAARKLEQFVEATNSF